MEEKTVLIVEDDREIAQVITVNIEDLGLVAEHVTDGRTGLQKALSGSYTLVILDIMLPMLDGLSICTKIREKDTKTPILMLTARAEEIDRVLGLELGADDYMTKPFSLRELTARVKALLRRSQTNQSSSDENAVHNAVTIGELSVDFNKRRVMLKGIIIELTVKEFDLISIFVKNPGRAFSRAELLNLVWEYRFEGYEHTVNTHINRLRNKIEKDAAHPEYLKTVWGVGYRFAEAGDISS